MCLFGWGQQESRDPAPVTPNVTNNYYGSTTDTPTETQDSGAADSGAAEELQIDTGGDTSSSGNTLTIDDDGLQTNNDDYNPNQ